MCKVGSWAPKTPTSVNSSSGVDISHADTRGLFLVGMEEFTLMLLQLYKITVWFVYFLGNF